MPDTTRRLAAILFADIAGYTAMMQHGEQEALDKLARFKQTLEAKTAEFQGNIIQYYGDACLVVFDSPVLAMSCAKAMQEAWRDAVPVRIGIHLGDVVFRENNAFGDAVNIASRIESMGLPGAVLMSETVRQQVKNHPEFHLTSLGSFEFKNADEPMEVFALANEGFPVPKRSQMAGKFKEKKPDIGHAIFHRQRWYWLTGIVLLALTSLLFYQKWAGGQADTREVEKSIAVLPFKNLSAEKENQYFCDGVMEAVLNHLSKIEGLKVIARTSMERYRDSKQSIGSIAGELKVANILEGSVQRQGSKVRISVLLIAAEKERQIWSAMYDRELTDVFHIQSEIAENIAGRLKIELSPKTKAMFAHIPTSDITAHDYYLRGRENLAKFYLDRKELYYRNALVHLYMIQGKYEQAEELAKEWYAKSPMGLRYLTEIEVNYHKNYRKAIGMYEEFGKHFPDMINFRQREGLAYWLNGQKDIGRKFFMLALKEYETGTGRTNNYCYDKIGIQATLGNIEAALAILKDKNCALLPYGLDHYCKIDPLFQNLWDNLEFQKIIGKRLAEKEAIRKRVRQATKGRLL